MTLSVVSLVLTIVFFVLGGIHLYWALGGQWGFEHSLPTEGERGERVLKPRKIDTVMVGIGLLAFGVVYLGKSGSIDLSQYEFILYYIRWAVPIIFILRAIGEFKYVGFFKKIKHTKFGRVDTKLFSPLCLAIGILGLWIQFS